MLVRGCAFGLTFLGLIGCDQVTNGLANIGGSTDATNAGIRTLALLDGDVRVRGPEGYCIDQQASNSRRGFAVMAGCALISDEVVVMPRLDGLVTVQFGAENTASITGNETAFATFLETGAGRAVLARNGDANALSDVTTVTDRSGVLVRFTDASGPEFDGTSQTQWRGFMDLNGRLTTVSVLNFDRANLSRSEAERLLIVSMNEIAAANASTQPTDENT